MGLFETFDVGMMQALNAPVGLYPRFDRTIRLVADWPSVRCAPFFVILWWAWFADAHARAGIVSGLLAAAIASLVSRVMQVVFYVHPRPFAVAAEYGLRIPEGVKVDWGHGSSFPSDTTTLHVALATTIAIVVPRLGIAALCWAVFAIALPRAYLTYHWPSDIIAGALLGAACVAASARSQFISSFCKRLAGCSVAAPQLFHPVAYLVCYQLMMSFEDVVQLLRLAGMKS